MNPLVKIALAFLVVVALAIGAVVWLGGGSSVELVALHDRLLDAARRHDPLPIMDVIPSDYSHGESPEAFRIKILQAVEGKGYESIGMDSPPEISVHGDRATMRGRYELTGAGPLSSLSFRITVRAKLEKREGRWWVEGVDVEKGR